MLGVFKLLEAVSQHAQRAPLLTQWGHKLVQGVFCICFLLRWREEVRARTTRSPRQQDAALSCGMCSLGIRLGIWFFFFFF